MENGENAMRNLYLARHGRVEFPGGVARCIGRTELPLSEEGRRQAMELREYFRRHPVEYIYSSPLERCVETAEIIAGGLRPVRVEQDLSELDMGEWENVPKWELKKSLETEPKWGERRAVGLRRFERVVREIIEQTEGDILCVTHAGINCCFLSRLLGTPLETSRALPQPYGGISRITFDECGNMQAAEVGVMPKHLPDSAE